MRDGRTTWTDAQLLEVLEQREQGRSYGQIAESMSAAVGRPVTRATIGGLLKRINDQTDAAWGEAGDGSMPSGLWRAGLAKRTRRRAAA